MSDPAGTRAEAPRRFASRYSRFVDLLKFLLPATALVLGALVVLWPQLMGGYGSLIVPMLVRDAVVIGDSMTMRQPRYSGQTQTDEPFEVVAETAVIDPNQPNRIRLQDLSAGLTRRNASDIKLTAASGVYYRSIDKLNLKGDIELTTSDGYRFQTEQAQISLARGRVTGDERVRGSGPTGTLEADRFDIRDGGAVLRFEGQVKVTVEPRSPGGAAS